MKKLTLLAAALLGGFQAFAQISTTSVAPAAAPRVKAAAYDSSRNWLGSDKVASYKGQTLYVTPKDEAERKYGYDFFYTHGETPREMLASYYSTPYERLAGKNFTVEDVQPLGGRYYAFSLKQTDDTLRLLFRYDTESEDSFPFQTMAYYEYLRRRVGRTYYIKSSMLHATDVKTGAALTFSPKDEWTVTDVTVVEGELALLLRRGADQSYVTARKALDPRYAHYFIPKELYASWVTRYGEKYADYAVAHKLGKGMHKELLQYSWGKPSRVESGATDDVYVYGSKRVRVDRQSGLVTSWE